MANDSDAGDEGVRGNGVGEAGPTGDAQAQDLQSPPEAEARRNGAAAPADAATAIKSLPEALSADGAGARDVDNDELCTPDPLYRALNARYGPFEVDLFATPQNTKCPVFFTKAGNAHAQRWDELREKKLFGNPPYSRGHQGMAATKARAAAERGKTVCLILQATTDTVWFHETLMGGSDLIGKETISGGALEGILFRFEATRCRVDVHLLKGRVKFVEPGTGKTAASSGKFGTLVAVWFPRLRW